MAFGGYSAKGAVRQYVVGQEDNHKKESFQEEFLRLLKKYQVPYDERYLWD
jgi:putative transposase